MNMLSEIKEPGLRVVTGIWGVNGWIWFHVDIFCDSGEKIHYELETCDKCNCGTIFVKKDKLGSSLNG